MQKPFSSLKQYRQAMRETAGYDIAPYIHKNKRGLEYLDFRGFVNEVFETVLSDTETHGCSEDMSKKECALSHLNEEVPEFCLFGGNPCVKTEVRKKINSEYANENRYSEDYGDDEDEYFRSRLESERQSDQHGHFSDPEKCPETCSETCRSDNPQRISRTSDHTILLIMENLRGRKNVKGISKAVFNQILKKHNQHPVMKQARALSVNGTKFVIIVSGSGMDHTFDNKSSFDSFIRDYDKSMKGTSPRRKTETKTKTKTRSRTKSGRFAPDYTKRR